MEVSATAKQIGHPASKVRLILGLVKGKRVNEALLILRYEISPIARRVAKVVKSAAANAENNYQMLPAALKVVNAYANEGATLKRIRSRSRGRVGRINKRSSHITIVVEEES
ncbi:MAG: rplV [Dehalococcoidia bacterium]|nr:rplV [Dehalococcoidia bacterium]